MKFSLRWLKTYVELTVPVPEFLERLTLGGTEVERVESTGIDDPHVVVGQILSSLPHPNADRLRVCRVSDGQSERQIVCGAKNFKDGDKAPLALPGAKLPGGLMIKESRLRGELSQGMLCSAKELALAEDAEGLLILPADAPVGKKFSEYRPGDILFEVEITSNRPDLLSYLGLAREIVALGLAKLKPRDLPIILFPAVTAPTYSAVLAAPELAPFYSAVHLSKIRVAPSPAWLQEAIATTGHRSINNVVDITNYVMLETGQPLHAFDAATLSGRVLHARRAAAGEALQALDDRTYPLTPEDLVIADETGPVAIAGVMGGKLSGVTSATTEIVLEAAWFSPATVRQTSRRLGLSSDSSYRYERRLNAGHLLQARDRALALLLELTGGEIVSQPYLAGAPPAPRGAITLRQPRVTQLLGVALPPEKIDAMLLALGAEKIATMSDTETVWQPPSARYDLEREVDLIEEIARLHGLAAIPARLRVTAVPESAADQLHDRLLRLRQTLAARGWDECVTDALIAREKVALEEPALELLNPLNELYTHLRPHLRTSLLQVAAANLARGVAQLRLFELGRVFRKTTTTTEEPLRLGLLVAGLGDNATWYQPERSVDFADLSGEVDFLQTHAGLETADLIGAEPVSKAELKKHGLKVPVFYAEFSLPAWQDRSPQSEFYQPVAAFPPVRRDLAVVVPLDLPQLTVAAAFRAALQPLGAAQAALLARVQLFDLFRDRTGEKIAADRKSLAYALTFRAADRTLTEREINQVFDAIRGYLVKEKGWSLRES